MTVVDVTTNATAWSLLLADSAASRPPANWTTPQFEPQSPPWLASSRGVFGTSGSAPLNATPLAFARATFELRTANGDLSPCLRALEVVPWVSGGIVNVAVNGNAGRAFDARASALLGDNVFAVASGNAAVLAALRNGTNVVTIEFASGTVNNASAAAAVFFGAAVRLRYGLRFADASNLLPSVSDEAGFIAGYVLGPFVLLVVALIAVCVMRRQVRSYGKESKRFIDI